MANLSGPIAARGRIARSFLAAVIVVCSLSGVSAAHSASILDLKPTVILISIDGFRADYLERFRPPNLLRLAAGGTRAAAMIPSFPTKTFPNHYTLVTGLYPAHHGIVSNNIYDPELHASFAMSERTAVQDPRWWGGEPIWVAAERDGQRTAPIFWPGSEAPIDKVRPSYWEPFDPNRPAPEKVTRLLAMLDLPAPQRPTFLTLYFDDVDTAGHDYGPDSVQARDAVLEIDRVIGTLMDGLRERGIADRVNIVVVSDHGMAKLSPEHVVFMEDYVGLARVEVIDYSPVMALRAKDGDTQRLYAELTKIPHATAYRREELPARWHYEGNVRIPPLLVVADEGWTITTRARLKEHKLGGGNHGFDNSLASMHAIFIAHGPAFRAGTHLPAFPNVNVYSLLAYLLRVQPAKTDGSLGIFRAVLKPQVRRAAGQH